MLTIVPTPIGNLKDITFRALEVLQSVDGIICEDTRRTSLLLNHFDIKKPLIVINDYNESSKVDLVLNKLISGQNLALVSDAGTPLISDPGFKLINQCLKNNIEIDSLPGPTSITTSLALSGLPTDKFIFLGYLPEKPGHRKEMIVKITKLKEVFKSTYIIFVSPYKLIKTLEELELELGNIEVVLEKELTKIHQTVIRDSISNILAKLKTQPPKGEYILLFNL